MRDFEKLVNQKDIRVNFSNVLCKVLAWQAVCPGVWPTILPIFPPFITDTNSASTKVLHIMLLLITSLTCEW